MEEYLTTNELAERIKMAPGSIRNLIWKGQLKEGRHFVKPTPRKLLFIWDEVQGWLHRNPSAVQLDTGSTQKSLINI